MHGHLYSSSQQQKADYIQQKISSLNRGYFPEDTKVSLIQFDHNCAEYELSEVQSGALTKLSQRLSSTWGGGGTEFSRPLQAAVDILKTDHNIAAAKGRDPENLGLRSLVFFLTDGQDQGASEIRPIVEQIRKLNAMTFICGIGEGYNMQRIMEIASLAGASTWSHVPLEHGAPDVFDVQIPAMIREILSEEHYIKIRAEGDFKEFSAMSPSIRDVPPGKGKIYSGYTGLSTGLLFERHDSIQLTLQAGRHVKDGSPFTQEIPIKDIADAGAYFERVRESEILLEKFLVLRALQERDIKLLEALIQVNPSLEPNLRPAIEDMKNLHSFDALNTHALNTSMSVTGYTGRRHHHDQVDIETGRAAQDLTRFRSVPASPQPPGMSIPDVQPNPNPHSGWLGPIDGSAPSQNIPAASAYKPQQYNDIQPRQELAPSLEIPAGLKLVIDGNKQASPLCLVELLNNREYVFGRADSSQSKDPREIRVAVYGSEHLSRHHFKIATHDGRYWITDLGSTNGTFLNTCRLSPNVERELTPGDQIAMAAFCTLDFKGPIKTSR
jgi:hypothetical protein